METRLIIAYALIAAMIAVATFVVGIWAYRRREKRLFNERGYRKRGG